MIDFHILGTKLVLRITETGTKLEPKYVEQMIDFCLQRVVAEINKGRGKAPIDSARFFQLTARIDLRISALPDMLFTYFNLGKQDSRLGFGPLESDR